MRSSVSDPGLVPQLAPGLMRLASRLAGSHDAEDLVQSTWVRSLEHDGDVKAPKSWLRRVLVNERRMGLRGQHRRDARERAHHETSEQPASVEDIAHCLEVARIIDELLNELDDDVQLVVRERYFAGDTAAQIARRHHIPPGTVRWRLKSGLDHLRQQLDARYGGRRALWAGGLAPVTNSPTLFHPVASETTTVPHALAATAKGHSAMSVKIVLAIGLAATAVGGAALVTTRDAAPTPPASEPAPALASSASPDTPPPATVTPKAAPKPKTSRERWLDRRARIQAARAKAATEAVAANARANANGNTWHSASGDELELGEHEGRVLCPIGSACFESLNQKMTELITGCSDFFVPDSPELTLTATVIGAEGEGTIIDSVELSKGKSDEASADLVECLTESMYTLELDPVEDDLEREISITLGGSAAKTEAAQKAQALLDDDLTEHGHPIPEGAHTVFVGVDDPDEDED
ncbi:MAG: sigma-70 family RNA polymerase sigma factor [Myxococcota bacterium]